MYRNYCTSIVKLEFQVLDVRQIPSTTHRMDKESRFALQVILEAMDEVFQEFFCLC